MEALIANPIYDVCFKYLMEDTVVAKHLLSALLKKEVLEISLLNRELPSERDVYIKMFRIDFSARIKSSDGGVQQVIIELQKSWVEAEILRFRRYLGSQYSKAENVIDSDKASEAIGVPIVSIYILGHNLVEVKYPVIYVKRSYLDYDENPISGKDNFIESLTHDSIVVQIPSLPMKTQNRLDKLLRFFDQRNITSNDAHYLSFDIDDEDLKSDDAIKAIEHRLSMAAKSPEIREIMEMEDEIMIGINKRDAKIVEKEKELVQKIAELEHKEKVIEEKDQVIEEKDQMISSAIKVLSDMGLTNDEIEKKLGIK